MQYERKPYTTKNGQNVELYSIVMQDFNGDGVINDDDVNGFRTTPIMRSRIDLHSMVKIQIEITRDCNSL